MFLLVLMALASTGLAVQKDGKILLLNKDQLLKHVKTQQYMMAFFTREECSKCDEFYDALRQQSEMIVVGSPGMPGVPIAKIDLTNNTDISELNIQGFPTTRFYANGSYSEYDGEWDARQIQYWVEERTNLFFNHITEDIFVTGYPLSADVCVLYFHQPPVNKNDTIPFLEEYKQTLRLFKRHKESVQFSHTALENAKERLNVSIHHDLVLWTERGRNYYTYQGERTIEAFYEWLKAHRHPPVMHFNSEKTIQTIFSLNDKKLPTIFLITLEPEISEGVNISLYQLDKQYKKSLYFVHVSHNESNVQYNRLMHFLGVSNVRPPLAVIYNPQDQQKKYRLQTSIIPESIKRFIEDFFNNSLQPYYKTQSVPDEQNNKKEIIDVVGANFDKKVIQEDKPVLLYFYANWCKICQSFAPIYQQVFNNYKEKVVFARIEASENEISNHYIASFPAIKLFQKGNKANPITYSGSLNQEELVAFLNKELKLKVQFRDDL